MLAFWQHLILVDICGNVQKFDDPKNKPNGLLNLQIPQKWTVPEFDNGQGFHFHQKYRVIKKYLNLHLSQ